MTGWRARIGVIYPSDGFQDDEFWRCVPSGVSVHVTRSAIRQDLKKDAERLAATAESPEIDAAATTFALIKPACVAYACTSVSFARGVGYDADIITRIRAAAGSPATTTTTAMTAGLHALGVHRVCVAAPYVDDVCARLRKFLEDSGFQVLNLKNLGLRGVDIAAVPADRIYALGREAMTPHAEALLIPCTGLRTLDIIDGLEQDLGRPVVTANQATMWHALRTSGISTQLANLGALYRLEDPVASASPRAPAL